jgi:2-polyprenyl-6-methoxyphenol hydroxylase-like FAD-dependent oxidoreductase
VNGTGAGRETHVPVLIVGGGPVGLALAIELGRLDVDCLVVEQTDGGVDHPRASALNARTMEFCRRWGIRDKVVAVATPPEFPQTVIYVTNLNGHEIARIERPTHGSDKPLPYSPEGPQRCNQLWFNPVLAECAGGLESVTFRTRCRFAGFETVADGIVADIENISTGGRDRVRADYLVACCGGRSTIPASLGVAMDEDSVLSHSLNIFFRAGNLWDHHDKGPAALNFFIGPEGLWGGMTAQDGRELWRITIHGDKRFLDPAEIDAGAVLRRAMGADFPFEIINVVPWTRRDWVAGTYREGRVVLAGDAAHQNSPTGGFGMNTGLGDAVDLGWKLAALVHGWGGPRLIGAYETERRSVALRNVGEATGNFARYRLPDCTVIDDNSLEGDELRREVGRGIIRSSTRQYLTDGIALGYRYDPSPLICADGSAATLDEASNYTPTARPGSRAPHAWLEDGRSTLDLFGAGFTLLRLGAHAPAGDGFEAAAIARRVPLTVAAVPDAAVHDLYERALVLVRPDGHVAWRGDKVPVDAMGVIDRVRGADI